jgi:hypothetical protein
MSNHPRNTNAVCPYYKKSENNYIECEGLIKNARTRELFDTVQDLEIWMARYCDQFSWDSCPHACVMNKIYDAKWRRESDQNRQEK